MPQTKSDARCCADATVQMIPLGADGAGSFKLNVLEEKPRLRIALSEGLKRMKHPGKREGEIVSPDCGIDTHARQEFLFRDILQNVGRQNFPESIRVRSRKRATGCLCVTSEIREKVRGTA